MKLTFDKKLHLAFGAFIGLCVMLTAKDYGFNKNIAIASGAIATFLIAIGKEIYDRVSEKGVPEKEDIVWTIFGGFSLMLIYEFIKDLI